MNRPSLFLLGAIAVAGLFAPTGKAQASTYCLAGEMNECRFVSLEQCLAAANGVGGYCVPDSYADETSAPTRARHR